eukprot:2276257-Prymnesium_polylepis.1
MLPAASRGASQAVFTYRSAAAAGRSMTRSDSVHGVQKLRERNENLSRVVLARSSHAAVRRCLWRRAAEKGNNRRDGGAARRH